MAYPEKNASYRNKPAWMDRAVAGEKRAQGGPIEIGNRSVGNGAGVSDVADAAQQDAGDDLSYAMNRKPRDTFHDSGLKIPGKLKGENDTRMAPRRADGGPLIDKRGRTLQQLAADDPNGPPLSLKSASSPSAAEDAREQAAERTRRAATSPREPGPITKSLVAAGATPLVLGRLTADTIGRAMGPANEQVANGVGQTMRRRGGRT